MKNKILIDLIEEAFKTKSFEEKSLEDWQKLQKLYQEAAKLEVSRKGWFAFSLNEESEKSNIFNQDMLEKTKDYKLQQQLNNNS